MKTIMVAALVAATGTQAYARETDPVSVEVIGTGAIEIRASSERFSISYNGRGATAAAAETAKARKEAEVLRLLAADGVPATAITPLSASEQAKLAVMGGLVELGGAGADGATGDDAAAGGEEARGGRTVQVPTLAQATALTAKLRAVGVQVGDPTPSYDNVGAARRDARLAALTDARAGASRYAAALGMKVGSVRRVSETGDGALLPGLQEKIAGMFATGSPGLMQQMMQPPKATAKIEEAVVVEFALLP